MKISVITCAQAALVIAIGYAMYTNKSFIDESKSLLNKLKPFEVGVATVVEGDKQVDIADKKARTVTAVLDNDKQMKMFVVQVITLKNKPIVGGSKIYLYGMTMSDPLSSTSPVYFGVQRD